MDRLEIEDRSTDETVTVCGVPIQSKDTQAALAQKARRLGLKVDDNLGERGYGAVHFLSRDAGGLNYTINFKNDQITAVSIAASDELMSDQERQAWLAEARSACTQLQEAEWLDVSIGVDERHGQPLMRFHFKGAYDVSGERG